MQKICWFRRLTWKEAVGKVTRQNCQTPSPPFLHFYCSACSNGGQQLANTCFFPHPSFFPWINLFRLGEHTEGKNGPSLWQSASISSSIIHNEQLYKLQLHINYGFQAWSCKSYALHWEFPTTTMLQGQSWTILFQAKWFSSYLDFRVNCPPFAAWRRTKIGQNISYCRITWLPLYLWFWHFLFLYATIYSSTSSVHVFSSRQKKTQKKKERGSSRNLVWVTKVLTPWCLSLCHLSPLTSLWISQLAAKLPSRTIWDHSERI